MDQGTLPRVIAEIASRTPPEIFHISIDLPPKILPETPLRISPVEYLQGFFAEMGKDFSMFHFNNFFQVNFRYFSRNSSSSLLEIYVEIIPEISFRVCSRNQ